MMSTMVTSAITCASTSVGTWLNIMACSKLGPGHATAGLHEQQPAAILRTHAPSVFICSRKTRSVGIMQMSLLVANDAGNSSSATLGWVIEARNLDTLASCQRIGDAQGTTMSVVGHQRT